MKIDNKDQIEKLMRKPFITRTIHNDLLKSLYTEEVVILYGARQVGKSTEVRKLISTLLDTPEAKDIFYFNLDETPADFGKPDSFVNAINSQKNNMEAKTYIFIDEAQRVENIGLFVKYIYDANPNIKFVLTGSASLEIKEKTTEPLTGRKREFYLAALSFREFLSFRGINPDNLAGNFADLDEAFENYMLYGGFPQVAIIKEPEEKKHKLLEIAESYIVRDISKLFGLTNTESLRLVATYLAENVGNILSKDNLCKFSGLTKSDVENCLIALEKSFVLNLVRPFARDKSKELTHRPKIYFCDLGIRNAVLKKLDKSLIVADKGALFENLVLNTLHKPLSLNEKVGFWRTDNQTEVDFIVSKEAGKIDAYEVKYSYEGGSAPRSLLSFKNTYNDTVNSINVVSKDTFWKLVKAG